MRYDRLDLSGYTFDLRALRRSVRSALGQEIYRRRGAGVEYKTPVHVYAAADVEGDHILFDARVLFEKMEAQEGYEYVGAFHAGDAHSMQPDRVRDDRMYGHYVWPLRKRSAA